MSLKQALAFGAMFGLVAALIVWYLERFELNRLHGEMRDFLDNHDRFQSFLKEREENG